MEAFTTISARQIQVTIIAQTQVFTKWFMKKSKKILVIGGTGHLGGRICRRLVGEPNTSLFVTSRNQSKAQELVAQLQKITPDYPISGESLDQSAGSFERDFERILPDIVVHTAGPYQGQSHRVAEACIALRAHYVDLADGRKFVEGFKRFDSQTPARVSSTEEANLV